MRLPAAFTEHPASVGETYGGHARSALSFAGPLLLAACACAVHAVLPFLVKTTGSRIVTRLHERMVTHRHADARGAVAARPAAAPAATQQA
jgi:hypothetical protein